MKTCQPSFHKGQVNLLITEHYRSPIDFATDIFRTVADQKPRVIWGDEQEMLLPTRYLSRPAVREVDVRIVAYFEIVVRFDGGGKPEIRLSLSMAT